MTKSKRTGQVKVQSAKCLIPSSTANQWLTAAVPALQQLTIV